MITLLPWVVSVAKKLSRDESEPENVVALKIINTNKDTADDEREIEAHIAKTDPSHHAHPVF